MRRILLVEDDDFFREALKDHLVSRSFLVTEAPNGKVAKDILGTANFDLIITDVQMPFLSGLELVEWLRGRIQTPILLITGFSHLVETKQAHELGVNEFLSKPFKNVELDLAIKRILSPEPPNLAEPEINIDGNYCKVSIDEFVARPKIEFDVFIRLSEKKYVRIGSSGNEFPREQIQAYKHKGVKFLHIHKDDFSKLVGFNLHLAKVLSKTSSVSAEKRMNFMKYTAEVILEKSFVSGLDENSFSEAKDLLAMTVGAIVQNDTHLNLLEVLNGHSDHIYAHSLGVSMYAIMIARKLGYESSTVFFKLSLAGLYHDIGKKEIGRELLEKSRPLLTVTERQMIESHPARGRDILAQVKGFPSDVIQLVYEHHEDRIGQGFPRGITARNSHPMSPILQVANHFVEHALKSPHSEGMPARAAIAQIEMQYSDRMDLKVLAALKAILK